MGRSYHLFAGDHARVIEQILDHGIQVIYIALQPANYISSLGGELLAGPVEEFYYVPMAVSGVRTSCARVAMNRDFT